MCQYTQLEEAQIKSDVRMCFAVNSENALLASSDHSQEVEVRKQHARNLRTNMAQLPGLRCRPGFTAFNIYPTSEKTLAVNKFLWETVHNGYYDSEKGNPLFGENVFVLGLGAELFDFLVHVSLEALDVAIIDFLVLLHHQLTIDGDVVGVTKLQEELLPQVWEQVRSNIGVFENGEPREPERAATLEHLVQISFMTPWRVDVLAGYLSTSDMGIFLNYGPIELSRRLPSFGADSVGVRGSAVLKLYRDWQVYDDVFCKRLSMKRNAALEAMDRAMYCGKSICMYEQAASVVDLCEAKNSLFSLLPIELVERAVVPWIVRRNCETIAPRQRRLATLKSLLELSSKFFDELDGGGDAVDVMMADDAAFADEFYGDGDLNAALGLHELQLEAERVENDEALAAMGLNGDEGCPMSTGSTSSEGLSEGLYDYDNCVPEGANGEYPLDARPRRYSRLERHGGVINLPGVVEDFNANGGAQGSEG